MNVSRIPEYLLRWTVTLFWIGLSIYLIQQGGYGNYGKIALTVAAVSIITVVLIFREKIWMLLACGWYFTGNIPELGIPFNVRELATVSVFVAFLMFRAFKVIKRNPPWDGVSLLAFTMVLYLVISWVRNPVGVAALNSERVGGRPYFVAIIGIMAWWVLSQCSLPARKASRSILTILFARTLDGVMAQLTIWFPILIAFFERYYISPGFMWAMPADDAGAGMVDAESRRLGYLIGIGIPMVLCYAAFMRPFSAINIFRPWRLLLLGGGLFCIALSGFRSVLLFAAVTLTFSAYFWHGWRDVWKICLVGLSVLVLFMLGNGTVFNLPFFVQRAFSFLPGNWDRVAIQDASNSTTWRVEMWKVMLTSNRFIENHTFGDGFGFRKRDLEIIAYLNKYGSSSDAQESIMISGGIHSGPVSAVRYVGYVGLLLTLVILVAVARKAWMLLWRARGTPIQYMAFVICAPPIFEPFFFTFIFGAFENVVPDVLFTLGMLRMLGNTIEDYEQVNKGDAPSGTVIAEHRYEPELAGAQGRY